MQPTVDHDVGSDRGRSLVGLLIVLCLLGGLGALVLNLQSGSSNRSGANSLPGVGGLGIGGAPSAAGNDIQAGEGSVCRADFQTFSAAIQDYEALNGHPPANLAALGSQPTASSDHRFTIGINPAHPGELDVSTPSHSASAGDANCAYA